MSQDAFENESFRQRRKIESSESLGQRIRDFVYSTAHKYHVMKLLTAGRLGHPLDQCFRRSAFSTNYIALKLRHKCHKEPALVKSW